MVAPGWVDTAAAAPAIQIGVVKEDDIIPMKTITDAFFRFFNDASLSGEPLLRNLYPLALKPFS